MESKRRGFTLIELIIVIVIIGILAAIAAPMLVSNVQRARRSEAVSIMGAIRTAERLYFVDWNNYTNVGPGAGWNTTGPLNAYIRDTDFNGRYFNSLSFSVTNASATDFIIACDPSLPDVSTGFNLYMNANGLITNYD